MLGNLRDKIETELNTLTGLNKPFVSVFPAHTLNNTGFPYVSFEPTGFTAEYLDNCNNTRLYNFDIYVYQEITNEGRDEALNIIIKGIEDIITVLDSNYTLDGLALGGTQPVNMNMVTAVGGNGNILVGIVTISCKVIQSII